MTYNHYVKRHRGGNNSKPFPKIIWRYWHQGWENVPFPLNYCTESIRHYAPDWKIVDLDSQSVKQYIEIPGELETPGFPLATLSDYIRIKLLEKYGGVWIDATIFLNQNLTDFLQPLQGDFFCFWRWAHKVTMSSWFLAATIDSYIAKRTSAAFSEVICSSEFYRDNHQYFGKWRGSPDYYIFHRTFESLVKKEHKFDKLIKAMPFRDSSIVMHSVFDGWNKSLPAEYEHLYLEKSPMVKLSHAVKKEDYNPESVLGLLLKKMKGEEIDFFHHLHLSLGLRTTRVFNSFINRPDKVGEYAGQFESEADLKLCSESYNNYHVYNFSSIDGRHGAQLLIPHDTARIFLRFQQGNSYSEAREVAFIDETVNSKTLAGKYDQNLVTLETSLTHEIGKQKKELSRLVADAKKTADDYQTLQTMLRWAMKRSYYKRRYFFYRLGSHFTFGQLKQHCTQEKRRLRIILRKMEAFDSM